MSLLKYPRCRLSYTKIVQTERYELAQIPEVPPILCKNTENNQLKIEMYWKIFNEHRFFLYGEVHRRNVREKRGDDKKEEASSVQNWLRYVCLE